LIPQDVASQQLFFPASPERRAIVMYSMSSGTFARYLAM
jgi:hypothetical protein